MNLTATLQRLAPDLGQVFTRYPVSALAAIGLWVYLMLQLANGASNGLEEYGLGLIGAFIAAGVGHLIAEGRGLGRAANLVLAAVLAGVTAVILTYFRFSQVFELFLLPGLVLTLLVAPFLKKGAEQGAIWLFGQRMGLAALLAIVVGVAFGGGLSAIVKTVEFLLGIVWPNNIHEYIWLTATCLVGPLYGLSLVPANHAEIISIDDHKDSLLERGVSVLVNYVIVPLVVIYALIIHAYAVKTAATWTLPKGEIGTITTLFAFAGTAAWLISWPWRDKGTWLLRKYARHWLWLIPVPAVLLSIAVVRRIADYGVTPERYGLVLIAVWIFALFAYLLLRRKEADMRAVIGGIALLLIAGSFGPWGANGMTAKSQMARLVPLMEGAGLLRDGKIALPAPTIPQTKKHELFSMITVLGDAHALGPVIAMMPEKERPAVPDSRFNAWAITGDIHNKLGLADAWVSETALNYTATKPLDIKVPENARLLGPFTSYAYDGGQVPLPSMRTKIEQGALRISGERANATVELPRIADAVRAARSAGGNAVIALDAGGGVQIVIYEVYGDSAQKDPINSISFWLVVKE